MNGLFREYKSSLFCFNTMGFGRFGRAMNFSIGVVGTDLHIAERDAQQLLLEEGFF